jgi:peroxiredoxin Q/BCP
MKLKKGQVAPDFDILDIEGKKIKLSDYKDKKLLICFFRYAGCPFCNLLLHNLIVRYPKLNESGLEIIVFIQSPKESIIERTVQKQHLKSPFPLIADPDQKVYKLYGVEPSLSKFAKTAVKLPLLLNSMYKNKFSQGKIDGDALLVPAFFLVGPSGLKIYSAYYSPDFATMIPDLDIANFAASE